MRKYVTAVQMLRRDSNSTTISEEDSSLDYHNEARQYEEKLIQVADMHAELMEFNARLTMQLTNKCVIILRNYASFVMMVLLIEFESYAGID